MSLWCATEKRKASSANNLGFEDKSSDRSLIYIKKNSGPRIDPWGTPARTLVQDDVWPLRTTLCLRFFRKHFIKQRRFSEIPYWFNLSMRPSCHTLSKALDISRKTPLTSRPLSNESQISWVIDKSWFTQESPSLKPDWLSDIN